MQFLTRKAIEGYLRGDLHWRWPYTWLRKDRFMVFADMLRRAWEDSDPVHRDKELRRIRERLIYTLYQYRPREGDLQLCQFQTFWEWRRFHYPIEAPWKLPPEHFGIWLDGPHKGFPCQIPVDRIERFLHWKGSGPPPVHEREIMTYWGKRWHKPDQWPVLFYRDGKPVQCLTTGEVVPYPGPSPNPS